MINEYQKIIESFSDKNVLVVGDLIVDVYHEGSAIGISAETPTLVVRHKTSRFSAGGAGFLVRNILALGGRATFITLTGKDNLAQKEKLLRDPRLKTKAVRDAKRTTTVKERFWSNGYKLLAWDKLDNRPSSLALQKKIFKLIKENIDDHDKIIISDYRHGLLTKSVARAIVALAKKRKKPIYIDSQVAQHEANHLWYKGADLFCLNTKEAESIEPRLQEKNPRKSVFRLQKTLEAKNIILKLGERGSISLLEKKIVVTQPFNVEAIDTVGAGDAFFAAIALGSNRPAEKELIIANAWAALATTIKGTTAMPNRENLVKILQ